VVSSGTISYLATNRPSYYYQGNTITVTARLTNNIPAPYSNSVVRYVLYRDPDNSNTPTTGELFLMGNGETAIFDGTVFSHLTNLVDVFALSTVTDQFSIANANIGSENTGTWKVYAEWITSCGGSVANSSGMNVTFTVIAACTPTAVVNPIFIRKAGGQYLVTWSAVSDPCMSGYVLLGSDVPNPPAWDSSLLVAAVPGVFRLGDLTRKYHKVLVQSIDGSYGPQ